MPALFIERRLPERRLLFVHNECDEKLTIEYVKRAALDAPKPRMNMRSLRFVFICALIVCIPDVS